MIRLSRGKREPAKAPALLPCPSALRATAGPLCQGRFRRPLPRLALFRPVPSGTTPAHPTAPPGFSPIVRARRHLAGLQPSRRDQAGDFCKDRKRVVSGKGVSVRVGLGGRRIMKKKTKKT